MDAPQFCPECGGVVAKRTVPVHLPTKVVSVLEIYAAYCTDCEWFSLPGGRRLRYLEWKG